MDSKRYLQIYCCNERCRKTTVHEKLEHGKLRCVVCNTVKEPKKKS